MYGLSSSNTIAPDEWNYFSGTSQSTTFEYATEGTYYLWVKDTAGNNAISEAITITLDAAAPAVGNIDAYTKNAVIALSDDNNLAGYAVTTTSTTPTNWTAVSGKTASVTYSTTANGTDYVHVKDAAGKTSSKSFSMACAASIIRNFDYTGAVQNYTTVCRGTHTLPVWGAQGGNAGGKGGYSTGVVNLNENMNLYIYVGGQGSRGSTGGFNGGGTTGTSGGTGGGASDIRIGTDSLYARVIVAGGGGGKGQDNCAAGGVGGGTTGGGSADQNSCGTQAGGGTQTAGGAKGIYSGTSGANTGAFGKGGNASDGRYDGGGGGGGWYGGGAGASSGWSNGGGGGSGYVYTSSTASSYPSGCLLNNSYYLTNASTTAGSSSFPGTSSSSETGHSGNGYARIVYNP